VNDPVISIDGKDIEEIAAERDALSERVAIQADIIAVWSPLIDSLEANLNKALDLSIIYAMRVTELEYAARLVIREHNCGDIEACYVCGPLDAALAPVEGSPRTG
jgi:hypothetical protein